MSREPAVSDAQLARALGGYAAMVDRVLGDPSRWLGLDDDPAPTAGFPARALDAVRDRAFGEVTPASPGWGALPLQQRVDWWVRRISVSAGLAAAAPHFAGALADRVPLAAGLSASAAGLAVCATAREHGVTAPQAWVPLLSEVLLDRRLAAASVPVPDAAQADQQLDDADEPDGPGAEDPVDSDGPAGTTGGRAAALGRGAQRAARTLWHLARAFWDLQGMLDERPRGGLLARGLAKLPVVGVAGGWLDERGAIRKASQRTARLLG